MRRNGEPELEHLIHWEVGKKDSTGPKRMFIVGFNGDDIITEVVIFLTGEYLQRNY
ncbi:hypothetical protein HY500_00030 [Candidatus Woesearchaeota archaeon]|nr:hypothetical protein [Candidatus Woesearchaeota archaeon]